MDSLVEAQSQTLVPKSSAKSNTVDQSQSQSQSQTLCTKVKVKTKPKVNHLYQSQAQSQTLCTKVKWQGQTLVPKSEVKAKHLYQSQSQSQSQTTQHDRGGAFPFRRPRTPMPQQDTYLTRMPPPRCIGLGENDGTAGTISPHVIDFLTTKSCVWWA